MWASARFSQCGRHCFFKVRPFQSDVGRARGNSGQLHQAPHRSAEADQRSPAHDKSVHTLFETSKFKVLNFIIYNILFRVTTKDDD